MAASPDLSGGSPPAELKLRAVTTLPPAKDRGRRPLSSSPEAEEEEGGGGECHTPTSKESKIPTITSCPPAPKKSRRLLVVPCKRRLSDLELFRVGPELMYQLFRPLDAPSFGRLPAPPATKKRKLCYPNHE